MIVFKPSGNEVRLHWAIEMTREMATSGRNPMHPPGTDSL